MRNKEAGRHFVVCYLYKHDISYLETETPPIVEPDAGYEQ